jgi:hypothetical protein
VEAERSMIFSTWLLIAKSGNEKGAYLDVRTVIKKVKPWESPNESSSTADDALESILLNQN